MIWTDVIEEFPDGGYIHPLYDGQGYSGRKYRPVWHSVRGDRGSIFDEGQDASCSGGDRDE